MSVRALRRGTMAGRGVAAGPTTYTLNPTVDGYISSSDATYATARAGSALTVDTAGTGLLCGQFQFSGTYYIREAFLSFDTSAVVGTITSATLSLYHGGQSLAAGMTIEARLHPWGATLTSTDWVAGASLSGKTLLASFAATSGNWTSAAYSDLVSQAAFLSSINQSGTTDILLCSDRQTAGNTPAAGEYLVANSKEAAGGTWPKLVIVAA